MSTITGASSSGNPWAALNAQRSQMQAKMFAKTDADGNGSVDQTELQTMLTDMAQKSGSTVSSTDSEKLFSQMDSNADGKLSSEELAQGMQSILPPPPSTMDFAQSRSSESSQGSADDNLFSKIDADGNGSISKTEFDAGHTTKAHGGGGAHSGGMHPPSSSGTGGTSASSSTSYDPLDTNQDGTVSVAERLAGSSQSDPVQDLFKAVDTDGDGKISSSESDAFVKQLTDQVSALAQSGDTNATDKNSQSKQQGFDLSQLARKMYDQVAGGLSQKIISQSLSAMA